MEDPANEAPDDVFTLSKTIENAGDQPEYVTIDYDKGTPVKVNGRISPVDLLTKLNQIGAEHGVGQIDMVENRLVGIKIVVFTKRQVVPFLLRYTSRHLNNWFWIVIPYLKANDLVLNTHAQMVVRRWPMSLPIKDALDAFYIKFNTGCGLGSVR